MKTRTNLCQTCSNNFVSKVYRYYQETRGNKIEWIDRKSNCIVRAKDVDLDQLIITWEEGNYFCVYTHEHEQAAECSFYTDKRESILLPAINKKESIDSDSASSVNFQDTNRLPNKTNERSVMKTTTQKVNEARRTSGSGKRGSGKKGANKPSNNDKK